MTEDAQAEAEQVIYDYECGAVEHNELVAALAAAIEVQDRPDESNWAVLCEALSALRARAGEET